MDFYCFTEHRDRLWNVTECLHSFCDRWVGTGVDIYVTEYTSVLMNEFLSGFSDWITLLCTRAMTDKNVFRVSVNNNCVCDNGFVFKAPVLRLS